MYGRLKNVDFNEQFLIGSSLVTSILFSFSFLFYFTLTMIHSLVFAIEEIAERKI